MKINRILFPAVVAACLSMTSAVGGLKGGPGRSTLPTPSTAKEILNNTTRHREWVRIPVGSTSMLAFLVYPERTDQAPAVLLTHKNESATVLARAVADQLAAEGFISIVPDDRTGLEAARKYVAALPAANGTTVELELESLTAVTWSQVVGQLSRLTGNHLTTFLEAPSSSFSAEHAMHMGRALMPKSAQQGSGGTAP